MSKAENLKKIKGIYVPSYSVIRHDEKIRPIEKMASIVVSGEGLESWRQKPYTEYTRSIAPDWLYAVRSSATSEDGDDKSFAGMFLTKLNVLGTDVYEAILEVRASASSDRVQSYDNEDQKVDVIIQEMVDAKISGVLFSVNPVDGSNEMIVEYQDGVGGVVDGNGESTMETWDKGDRVGKFDLNDLTPLWQDELRKEAIALEGTFGKPVDIEWAVDDEDKLWILQVRPITAIGDSNVE